MFYSALYRWKKAVFDVKSAFFEGDADVVQYAKLPAIISKNVPERVRIKENWYGTKQAPKIWNDKFNTILIDMGFKRCPWDACLYYLNTDDGDVILINTCR